MTKARRGRGTSLVAILGRAASARAGRALALLGLAILILILLSAPGGSAFVAALPLLVLALPALGAIVVPAHAPRLERLPLALRSRSPPPTAA